ncbi:hypothetical protein E308F_28600 [Moorella sp. E308F]|uniref:SEC-C domain-containing protein n=1 Tax=Moorella sp. E308F TaxID=2572682 RepID=UPI0010FFB877|nr:SEC-C domain-containing protein [Moorella sp. E308F]GEA16614.1 hypothetical protein E308F_28600 [Moorella sp. E308F]
MQIYQVERNDFCPCGSGRKYKKCCLPAVEEATRAVGREVGQGLTAHGQEVLATVGFICGLKWSEETKPLELSRVGRLLKEAWEEEDNASEKAFGDFLENIRNNYIRLLQEKPRLRMTRIPPDILLEIEAHQESEEELKECLAQVVAEMVNDDDFISGCIIDIAYSLHYDSYTDEEMKTLLSGLGMIINKDTREGFIEAIMSVTMEEFDATMEKIKALQDSTSEEDPEFIKKLMEILEDHIAFGDYFYTKLLRGSITAMEAIIKKEIKLNVPFYALARGVYTLKKIPGLFENDWIAECLWEENEAEHFLPAIYQVLEENRASLKDEALAESLEKFIFASQVGVVINNPELIEKLYHLCVYNFLKNPLETAPDTGGVFTSIEDLYQEEKVIRYAEALKARGLEKEADYVLAQFRTYL